MRGDRFQIQGASVTFWLRVRPGSRSEALKLTASGDLRLDVSAPAAEGRANEACIRFLARTLLLPEACVAILAGQKSRRKLLRITGHSPEETIHILSKLARIKKNEVRK